MFIQKILLFFDFSFPEKAPVAPPRSSTVFTFLMFNLSGYLEINC